MDIYTYLCSIVCCAWKLILIISGHMDDPEMFVETSGLGTNTMELIFTMKYYWMHGMRDVYPVMRQVADAGVNLLYTADDLDLLDLQA